MDIDADGTIEHVDGTGQHHRYRLVALPDPRYPLRCPRAGVVPTQRPHALLPTGVRV